MPTQECEKVVPFLIIFTRSDEVSKSTENLIDRFTGRIGLLLPRIDSEYAEKKKGVKMIVG